MSYTVTVVPATATPAAAIVTAIETELTTHPSWTFVEEVTQTDVHRIWRCEAADNVAGIDFHVAFVKPATATTLGLKVFEGWNLSTHRMHRPVPNSGSATPVTADLTTGATELLLTDSTTAGQPYAPTKTGLSTSTDHPLHIFVTKSRIVVVDQGQNLVFAAGAWPVQAGITDARFKNIGLTLGSSGSNLLGGNNAASGGSTAAFTRSAPVGGTTIFGMFVLPGSLLREGTVINSVQTASDPMTSRFLAGDVALLGPFAYPAQAPGFRGLWPDAVFVQAAVGTPLVGDVVLGPGSVEYVCIGTSSVFASAGSILLSKTLADV